MQQHQIEKQIVYSLAFLLAILIIASCMMPALPTTTTPSPVMSAPTGAAVTIENTSW